MRKFVALLPLLILVLAPAHAQDDDGPSPGELKAKAKISKTWADLADVAVKKKMAGEAKRYAELAIEAFPDSKAAQKVQAKAEKVADKEPTGPAKKAFDKKEAKARTKVAKIYDSLTKGKVPAERRAAYAISALDTEPNDSRWNRLVSVLKGAYKAGEKDVAKDFITKAMEHDPPPPEAVVKKLTALSDTAAMDGVVLRHAPEHGMRYFLSLPRKYKHGADRKWPVLVCVDGAGSQFKKAAERFADRRGDLPCLVVSPCGFANTNAIKDKMLEKYRQWYDTDLINMGQKGRINWDLAGLLAILDDLKERYNAADQVCITGFSGGGNLAYNLLLKHPKRVLAAAPACANFSRPDYDTIKGKHTDEDMDVPIFLITGGQDPHKDLTFGKKGAPGIEPQTDWAVIAFKEVGFKKFKRKQFPKMKHSPAHKEVVEFFTPYILGKTKRSDPLR